MLLNLGPEVILIRVYIKDRLNSRFQNMKYVY